MFTKQTVKAFSIVAIILSCIGLLLSVIGTLVIQSGSATFAFFLGIISWALLLWSGIIGFQLSSSYRLDEEQYKKVGIRVCAIIIAFVLCFFVGLIGIAVSVVIFVSLWALKSNFDDWKNSEPEAFLTNDGTGKGGDATNN